MSLTLSLRGTLVDKPEPLAKDLPFKVKAHGKVRLGVQRDVTTTVQKLMAAPDDAVCVRLADGFEWWLRADDAAPEFGVGGKRSARGKAIIEIDPAAALAAAVARSAHMARDRRRDGVDVALDSLELVGIDLAGKSAQAIGEWAENKALDAGGPGLYRVAIGGTVPQDGRGSVLHADVVLWTGDITDHGYPHEFDLALQFAEDLKKATFITKPCLFSIAPGNHDCCWPLALASRLKTANKAAPMEEKFATGTSDEWEWTLTDTTVNEELWRFSLAPFQQFYSKLIDELSLNKGFNWRPHWKHIGFAILELPIEGYLVPNRKNQSPQPQPFISEQEFKDTTNRALAEVEGSSLEKTVCIFVLIHGRDPDDQQNAQRWNDLLNQLGKKGNPLIVLGGHEHLSDHSYHRNRLTLIGAPFDAIKVESGRTLPSVRFLKLYNLMANNLTCDITRLEKSAGDEKTTNWTQAEVRRYEINTANGHWQDMTKAMLINGRS